MKDISKGAGRTVLFVSHNMAAVKQLCNRGILLEHGKIKADGDVNKILNIYNQSCLDSVSKINWDIENAPGNANAKLTSIKFNTKDDSFYIEEEFELIIEFLNLIDNHSINASISIFDEKDVYVLASPNLNRVPLAKGFYKSICKIPKDLLNKGKYHFTVLLVGNNFEIITQLDKIVAIEIDEAGTNRNNYYGYWAGVVRPYLEWNNQLVSKLL
jgi:lipopolysaccharide transport system ATP-binding protein